MMAKHLGSNAVEVVEFMSTYHGLLRFNELAACVDVDGTKTRALWQLKRITFQYT